MRRLKPPSKMLDSSMTKRIDVSGAIRMREYAAEAGASAPGVRIACIESVLREMVGLNKRA